MGQATPHPQLPLEAVSKEEGMQGHTEWAGAAKEGVQPGLVGPGTRLLLTGVLPHGACGSVQLDTARGDPARGVTKCHSVEVRLAQHVVHSVTVELRVTWHRTSSLAQPIHPGRATQRCHLGVVPTFPPHPRLSLPGSPVWPVGNGGTVPSAKPGSGSSAVSEPWG